MARRGGRKELPSSAIIGDLLCIAVTSHMAMKENMLSVDEGEIRASYLLVSDNLKALIDAYDQKRPCYHIATLFRDLCEQCPSMRTPDEYIIADECLSHSICSRLGSQCGQEILDAVEKGRKDMGDEFEIEWESFDYGRCLLFFLGIAGADDLDVWDDNIEKVLDRIDNYGSLNDITNMRDQEVYTVFEVRGFLVLFRHEELPDWARLRILLLDSTTLIPEERSEIAEGLTSPTSFICTNLSDICEDVIKHPDKYEPRFAEALRAFVMDNLSLTADFLEDKLGDVSDDIRACRDAMSDSYYLESSMKLYIG